MRREQQLGDALQWEHVHMCTQALAARPPGKPALPNPRLLDHAVLHVGTDLQSGCTGEQVQPGRMRMVP